MFKIETSDRLQARKICPHGSGIIIETKKNPRRDMYARYIAEIVFGGKKLSDELLKLGVVGRFC